MSADLKKKSLQFAAFAQKEYESVGKEGVESVLPFNELQLMKDNIGFIQKEVKLQNIEVIFFNFF